MADHLQYEPADETEVLSNGAAWWPAAIVLAAVCVVAAGSAWARATPALGERALPAVQVWAARCTAASLWTAGQAVLLGVALPQIYRPRPTYAGLAAVCALLATLTAVSAAALWLASR